MIDLLSSKNILIVGYGVSGKSIYNFLKQYNHNIFIFDDFDMDEIPNRVIDIEWNNIDVVIKSPAIPFMPHNCHHIIKEANENDIPVISMFDVFRVYNPEAKIIGITGTNGKSTTTALIYHILKKAGFSIQMGGNIGIPYFNLDKSEWYVFEMSSYELASSRYLEFEIACVLNIEPDHMEVHGNFSNYVKSKHKILDHAKFRIISYEDSYTMTHYANSEAILKISTGFEEDPDIYIYENALRDKTSQRIILDLSGITNLRGKHNHQNIEFAYAICKKLGLASREISKHIQSFVPLPHRMSPVRKINNILFVNDSKATNPSSAAKALASFSGYNIYWLVGGRSKKTDVLSYIKNHLAEVQRIYLFGEDSQEFEKIFNGIKSTVKCNTLSSAINIAYKDATKETGAVVILLSPMCASFDQFQNFEERGNEFVKMVSNLE